LRRNQRDDPLRSFADLHNPAKHVADLGHLSEDVYKRTR
jgi:hypothetical protein